MASDRLKWVNSKCVHLRGRAKRVIHPNIGFDLRPMSSRAENRAVVVPNSDGSFLLFLYEETCCGDCDPDEWDLPPKPKWMRWSTYNRYVERYDAYEAILEDGIP
jgi:hypothetical protein